MRRTFTCLIGMVCLLLFITSAFAQNITVKGKVTDAKTAETLPGVSVILKGTSTGTVTDVNGQFSISAAGTGTLVISYIGFQNKEIAINNQTTLNVPLQSATTELEQVVVVGYGTQRKIDVTGAVAQVKGEEISKQSSPNAVSALQGKVAGVQITNSGSPGASPQIRIRGVGTVYGNANPLYVVDGVWFDDISFLNPADIENMSILKDASSESIYGVRAANGVVLVTTKKGKGKISINYSGYVGMQKATNLVKMANASEYATLINEFNPGIFSNPASLGEGTNWFNVVLRNALTTNHHVSIGGSTEKANYSLSVGYVKQEGVVNKNDYDRITARLQNDITATDFLKLGYTAVFQNNNSRDVPADVTYKAFTAPPVVPVRNADGSYGDPSKIPPFSVQPSNVQALLDFYNQQTKNYRITGNAYAELKIAKPLTFKTSFGGEFGDSDVRSYVPVYKATTNQQNENSLLSLSKSQTRNWIWENTLTFEKTFNDHRLTVLAGQSAQRYKNYNVDGTARGVPNTSTSDFYLALGPAATRTIQDGGDLATYQSFFGRVNYAFQNKYLINASLRADGSSKFVGNQRWGYFPSIGAGWVMSEEKFIKDLGFFDILKLRGSWGKIGNASVPANLSILTVNNTNALTAFFNGAPFAGKNITDIVPPVTYWERGVGTDIGLEAAIFKTRLSVEIDWYNKKTEQGIFAIPVLGSVGTSGGNIIGNQADFQNRGMEFALNWRDNAGDDFSYTLGGNFTFNNNKVLSVETGNNPIYQGGGVSVSGQLGTRTIKGLPIGHFYGLQVDGIFQTAEEAAASLQTDAKPGDFKYRDINGDGQINGNDRIVLGNPNPKYTFGLNTGFNYKQFDLAVDLQGVAGVDIYNANKGLRFGSENFSQDFVDNRWTGVGTSNTYPSADIAGRLNTRPNSWYVEDGSYVRIRNIQLGYTLPSALTKNWKLQRIRIYANAQNAFNFFKYTGFTPELTPLNLDAQPVLNTGIDNGVYPLSATYNVGVNVTF